MSDLAQTFINEEFMADAVSAVELDAYLANGWRHFGTHFFRYNLGIYNDEIRRVIPLRIRLTEFSLSKSQSRILRKNADLQCEIRPIKITTEVEELFERHKLRFKHHPPDSLYTFLSTEPAKTPCEGLELAVYDRDRLAATSFFDAGRSALSGVYAVFDPNESRRSLGIFTMLKEIEFAIAGGKEFYYQGYCYSGESFYDYKKRFRGTEGFDWSGKWEHLSPQIAMQE
jgi:leucyl-tRNA---protein transferase